MLLKHQLLEVLLLLKLFILRRYLYIHCFVNVACLIYRNITKQFMFVPSGNNQFCFPSNVNVSLNYVSENIQTLEKTKLFLPGVDIKCYLNSLYKRGTQCLVLQNTGIYIFNRQVLYDKLVYTCSVLVFVCVKPCRYLAVYDSDNRQKLLDAYDDEVSFYVKYNATLK